MAHRRLLLVHGRHVIVALLAAALSSASTCDLPILDAGPSGDCEYLCGLEADCGLRSVDECVTASCGGDATGSRVASAADDCVTALFDAEADAGEPTCADLVLCTCDESCGRLDECGVEGGAECSNTCATLVEQAPETTYVENRCRIESSCEDVAACSS